MNKRNSIKKAAPEIFAQKGFYITSVKSISIKANVSEDIVYYYFDSKETLLKELILDGFVNLKNVFLYNNVFTS